MSKNKIEIEGVMELSRVIAYLENLLEGLKSGTVYVQAGTEAATLCPPSIVDFEMEVAQKKDKSKITVEIAWKQDAKTGLGEGVKIGSSGPDIEVV